MGFLQDVAGSAAWGDTTVVPWSLFGDICSVASHTFTKKTYTYTPNPFLETSAV